MKFIKFLKDLPYLFSKSFGVLQKNNPLLLASATAFFTVFSTTPIIILIVNLLSLYFKSERISEEVFSQISGVFGESTATQIETFVGNFREMGSSDLITILGTVFLIFVATTLFAVIKQALNTIWNIRTNPKKKIKYNLIERGRAFLVILIGGVLFLVILLFETMVGFLKGYIDELFPQVNTILIQLLSGTLSLITVSVWFGIIFRFIPDARTKKNVIVVGALITGILFSIGKYLLGIFLVGGNVGNLFDASASIILFLLFIFYSAMIFYFGASFTLVYGDHTDRRIKPKKNAERYTKTAVKDEQDETVKMTGESD